MPFDRDQRNIWKAYLTEAANSNITPANSQEQTDRINEYIARNKAGYTADMYFTGAGLTHLPDTFAKLELDGNLTFEDCPDLIKLPDHLTVKGNLAIKNCPNLKYLPNDLTIGYALDLTRSNIQELPHDLQMQHTHSGDVMIWLNSHLAQQVGKDTISVQELQEYQKR